MSKKYLCPKHREDTPSANAYSDHYYCFGCGARGPLSELGLPAGERIEITYVEDVAATIAYIESLPRKEIRGFTLPYNSRGYYLVWPTRDYYKMRIEGADSGSKYRGPSGHKKPPFCANSGGFSSLVLVEGEFNALSLAALELQNMDIVSPGGAGDFYSKSGAHYLRDYAKRSRVDIVVDADKPGTIAAIETKAKLGRLGCPEVKIHLVERDFNDIHVQDGKEALRAEIKRMGLL